MLMPESRSLPKSAGPKAVGDWCQRSSSGQFRVSRPNMSMTFDCVTRSIARVEYGRDASAKREASKGAAQRDRERVRSSRRCKEAPVGQSIPLKVNSDYDGWRRVSSTGDVNCTLMHRRFEMIDVN